MFKDISVGLQVALLIMLIGFLYLFLVTFYPLPTTGIENSKTIVGFILGTVLAVPIGYYWGSSSKNNGSNLPIPKEEEKK